MARIDWKGKQVRDKVAAATALGIDQTMAAAVKNAKDGHPSYPPASAPGERFANRTGNLVNSIQVYEAAVPDAPAHISGKWGADADYALYVEIGTSRKSSGAPRAQVRAKEGGGDMWAIPGPSVPPLMAARDTLRPAAQEEYDRLTSRIAANFAGETGS